MKYEQAKTQIQTGDLVAVRGRHGVLDAATRFFTHDPHTHTGVAVWMGGRLFMADLNSGRNHLTALSQLADFDVYDPPAGLDRVAIERAIFDWLAAPINYGMAAFVLIGLLEGLRLKAFIHWRRIIVCSGGSVQIFEMAGWREHSRMVSPGALTREVGARKLEVRAIPA